MASHCAVGDSHAGGFFAIVQIQISADDAPHYDRIMSGSTTASHRGYFLTVVQQRTSDAVPLFQNSVFLSIKEIGDR